MNNFDRRGASTRENTTQLRNGNSRCISNCAALKKRFQQLEFAICEVVLYLDAYPNCTRALNLYRQLLDERNRIFEAIEEQCGPITKYGNYSNTSWQWVNGPWPWSYEAN